MLPFSQQKLALFLWTVIFSEGDYELSGWQNDKTSNIWYFVFATTTFALKLVAEDRSRMTTDTTFSCQNDVGRARALLSTEKIS